MLGRTIGLLIDMYAHVEPSGWRVSDRPGRDTRRGRSWLGEDLDALEEYTQGYEGQLKVQAVGPWTLAAGLELRGGEAALGDRGLPRPRGLARGGAVRASRRGAPPGAGRQLVLQLDEPSLMAVLRGQIRTASGYRTHRAVDRQVVEDHAPRDVVAVNDGPVIVHCCAPDVPFALLRRAGAAGVSFDFRLLTERDEEAVGEAVEGGTQLFAGVVPGTDAALSDPAGSVMGVRTLWRRLGLKPGTLAESLVVTPRAGWRALRPCTPGRRSPTASGRQGRSRTTLSDGGPE